MQSLGKCVIEISWPASEPANVAFHSSLLNFQRDYPPDRKTLGALLSRLHKRSFAGRITLMRSRLVCPMLLLLATVAGGADNTSAQPSLNVPTVLTGDRRTEWNPGMMAAGGVPARSITCARVDASAYGNGTVESSARIQAAIDSCPESQVVELTAGTFLTNNYIIITKGITLRGAGAGVTILRKTNGAKMNQEFPPNAQPNIIIGPNRWPKPESSTSQNLIADGAKGAYS